MLAGIPLRMGFILIRIYGVKFEDTLGRENYEEFVSSRKGSSVEERANTRILVKAFVCTASQPCALPLKSSSRSLPFTGKSPLWSMSQ